MSETQSYCILQQVVRVWYHCAIQGHTHFREQLNAYIIKRALGRNVTDSRSQRPCASVTEDLSPVWTTCQQFLFFFLLFCRVQKLSWFWYLWHRSEGLLVHRSSFLVNALIHNPIKVPFAFSFTYPVPLQHGHSIPDISDLGFFTSSLSHAGQEIL